MHHYVLFRLEPGYLTEEKYEELTRAFCAVADAVEGISDCVVRRNAVAREGNMDMMVSFSVRDEDTLWAYLRHPLHQGIVKEVSPHEVQRSSFDCM